MNKKKNLGQFFTTNSDKILQGFDGYVRGKIVLDPFAGGGDLLSWAERHGAKSVSGLDIDQKLIGDHIKENNSLMIIPESEFNLTNPPYLAKNKMTKEQKETCALGDCEDLYLLAIRKILHSNPNEGILIIPINFFSSEVADKIRCEFLARYEVLRVNYFTEQVFEDTTYNVCSFHYSRKTASVEKQFVRFDFFPDGKCQTFELERDTQYRIAGKELKKFWDVKLMKMSRLTEKDFEKNKGDCEISGFFNDFKSTKKFYITRKFKKQINNNIIILNCIDTNGSQDGWICAEDIRKYKQSCLVGKMTSRNIAFVMLNGVSIEKQENMIKQFNRILNKLRKNYNSLFLTNFRDNDRKRVSFEFCYKLLTYCYNSNEK